MQSILFIAAIWPEPCSSAAGYRSLQLIDFFLQQECTVTYACTAQRSVYAVDLESLGVVTAHIRLNDDQFDDFITQLNPDVVLFDRFMLEEQFAWRVEKQCPHAIRILDTQDIHSLRHARKNAMEQDRVLITDDYFTDMAKREVASILRSDLSLIISSVEIKHLETIYRLNSDLLFYLPFMLDTQRMFADKADLPAYSDREHFIFIGNFRHAPNHDAVLYLKQAIWPSIRKKCPDAECHIYGAYMPDTIRALDHQESGFLIKGRADSLADVMSKARVCLAPLRFGAGLKGKLIDAMLNGTPSVTSFVGAEGISQATYWNGFVTDDVNEMIEKAIILYTDRQTWHELQAIGFEIINNNFNKDWFYRSLSQRLSGLRQTLKQHRQNNFMGAILTYHSMRSTEYLSRWIEAKNRLAQD